MKKLQKFAIRSIVYVAAVVITTLVTVAIYNWRLSNRVYGPLKCDFEGSGCSLVTDLQYGHDKGAAYDLYLPSDKSASQLIVLLHGGGFVNGDKVEMKPWARFFATKGYVAASVNYPLYSDSTAWSIGYSYSQIEKAMVPITEECKKRGFNITEMAIGGESAGGTLAMLYAYKADSIAPAPVRFVFQQAAPGDFDVKKWKLMTDLAKHKFVSYFSGVPSDNMMMGVDEYKHLMDAISPVFYVDSTSVPTICAYGDWDTQLNEDVRNSLIERLEMFGVQHDYILYPNSGHRMIDDPKQQKEYVDKILEYTKKYFHNSH